VLGGAIASVTGFGIGSTLTPLVTYRTGAKLAVAMVSIPHFAGTAVRLWRLRQDINYQVLWTFGIMNAVGGLGGAVLHHYVQSSIVRIVFGSLLVFAGIMGLSNLAERMRLGGWSAWAAGIISGGLGGFSGTQGGIRAAALFGFDLPKEAFVATATATALLVDLARMPVYLWSEWDGITRVWPLILAAAAGVLLGTLIGERVLRRIPEQAFRKVVSGLILLLGIVTIFLLNSGQS
jgi:uncharacterized membrane protein YfcA